MAQHNPAADKNVLDVRKKRTAAAHAVRDFRTKQASVGDGMFAYELELLQSFAKNHVTAAFLMPIFVLAVALISAQWHNWMIAGIWACFTILAHSLLGLLSRRFLSEEQQQEDLDTWRTRFIFCQIVVSIAWLAFALKDGGAGDNAQYSIIQFSAILIYQAATFMLAYPMSIGAIIMVLPPTAALAFRYFLSYEPATVVMGVTAITAAVFFALIASRYKASVVSMLEHKTIREMLIVELETEKSISEAARNQAEDANLAKSRFLATMSHELRTPLNAILGFSEIMREELMGPIGNDQYREYAQDIHNSGSHLLKLINEILDISRIEAGRHDLNEIDTNLVDLVEEARHMMNIKAEQKNITLTTTYQDGLPKVWVDERSIRQIALNLISNALKFTPPGGLVTIKVGWTQKGGQYISIKDNGPGIPEAEIPLVLSSFGQGSIAIQHAEAGTGLGLTIVQALLHMHQGHFALKSKLREGTEAIAYLPNARVQLNSAQEPARPEANAKVA